MSTLEIHLDAVARNWLFLKKKLKNGSDCAAVVKADAYGLGAAPVAAELYNQGCRHFFTAHFDEATIVRKALPFDTVIPSKTGIPTNDLHAPVYVLNGPYGGTVDDFMAIGAAPVLNTLGDIEYWAGAAAQKSQKLPALLHIDTGMNRLGLSASDVPKIRKEHLDALDIRYVMSHLSCGDEMQHPMNGQQLELFKTLTAALGRPFRYSFANSGGIFLGQDYHFDLARPGVALYGINPTDNGINPMQRTVSLYCRILQTREIDRAGSVGYGAAYPVSPHTKCATISVGYADGYLRSHTGAGAVYIGGEKCPVIGRVSMDSIIVDISRLTKPCHAGDMAEVIGPNQSPDDLAAQAKTIGYEILTSLGKRYKRSYTGV